MHVRGAGRHLSILNGHNILSCGRAVCCRQSFNLIHNTMFFQEIVLFVGNYDVDLSTP